MCQGWGPLLGNQTHYIHTDHLGTPKVMTDTTGAKVWEIATRPFGEDVTTIGSAALNLRFPGQYVDEETQLNYNWNRYYDAGIGRYITSDPIGLAGGLNTYVYAKSNSLRFNDQNGLFTDSVLNELYAEAYALSNMLCDYIECVAKCEWEVATIFIAGNLASESLQEAAVDLAKKAAEQGIRRAWWVYSVFDAGKTLLQGAKCFVDCGAK